MKKVGVKDGVVVFLRCNTSQTETEGRRIEGLKKKGKITNGRVKMKTSDETMREKPPRSN